MTNSDAADRESRPLRLEVLTVFPEMFEPIMSTSIMGRARRAGIFEFRAHNLRDWTHDRHRTVDDAPYGGGQGMLMKPAPFYEAIDDLCPEEDPACVVFFTPTGERFTQQVARELSEQRRILFVCGHYEGIDQRAYSLADRCLSIGDYVLTGGELAALVVCDAVVRLLPGALGDEDSARFESFSDDGLLEYAQYTRPASYRGMDVPEVLLSGDHEHVNRWRKADALVETCVKRPDLLESARLSDAERRVAQECLVRLAQGETPQHLVEFVYASLRKGGKGGSFCASRPI
jgi:tRNA (guanine37-N1)-methyltransferase